jgi:hypothetical protein
MVGVDGGGLRRREMREPHNSKKATQPHSHTAAHLQAVLRQRHVEPVVLQNVLGGLLHHRAVVHDQHVALGDGLELGGDLGLNERVELLCHERVLFFQNVGYFLHLVCEEAATQPRELGVNPVLLLSAVGSWWVLSSSSSSDEVKKIRSRAGLFVVVCVLFCHIYVRRSV